VAVSLALHGLVDDSTTSNGGADFSALRRLRDAKHPIAEAAKILCVCAILTASTRCDESAAEFLRALGPVERVPPRAILP
jgi:hypothetical protein